MNFQDHYDDRTPDLIERIRKMRDAAQREMDKFGNPADYDMRKIAGQKAASSESPGHTVEGAAS